MIKHSHDWIAKEPRFLSSSDVLMNPSAKSPTFTILVDPVKMNTFPSPPIRAFSNLAILH